jgi:TPR repeat protein
MLSRHSLQLWVVVCLLDLGACEPKPSASTGAASSQEDGIAQEDDRGATGLPPAVPAASPKTPTAEQCRSFQGGAPADWVANHAVCETACSEGDMPSCGMVASNLSTGIAGKRNYARAVTLYDKVCASRDAPTACYQLGEMLDDGEHVPRDASRATRAWTAGCEQGDRMSCEALREIRYTLRNVALDHPLDGALNPD